MLVAVLAACGASDPEGDAPPTAGATTTAPSEALEALPSEPAASEPEKGAQRSNPYQPGDTFVFGDWELAIGETNTDATQEIIDAQLEDYGGDEEYTTPPDEGSVYITVPVTATFTGADRDDPASALTYDYVSADGHSYASMILGVSIPNDLYDVGELYNGATGEGDVLQMVPEGAAEGGYWRISETYMGSTAGEVYVASAPGQKGASEVEGYASTVLGESPDVLEAMPELRDELTPEALTDAGRDICADIHAGKTLDEIFMTTYYDEAGMDETTDPDFVFADFVWSAILNAPILCPENQGVVDDWEAAAH